MRLALSLITSLACLALGLPDARGANVLTNDWSLNIRTYSDSAPAVGPDGTVYFGTWDGKLWAVSPEGAPKWIFRSGYEIKSAPAVALDGTIYFGCRDRKLYAVGANGKERWEFPTGGWVDSSPALAHNGTVYFGSWDKNFYALSPNGKEQWRFATAGVIVSSPAIGTDGTIYFGSDDQKFYALTPSGKKKWEFATGGSVISSPAINRDQCLYFTSVDGCLYALNLDGSLRWRLRTGGITESSPVIGPDGTVYVGVLQRLWAISPDGKKKWGRVDGEDFPFETTPVVLAGGVVCGVSSYGLLSYYSTQGVERSMYYLFGYGYGSPAIGPNGDIYVPDRGLAAAGFSALRADAALARTPWPRFRGNSRNTGNILDSPDAEGTTDGHR